MLQGTIQYRVRYFDADPMGYCNNANYPKFYEMGRDELFREIGLPYTEVEKAGFMLPLADLHVRYIKPSKYDDLLTITTTVTEYPTAKIVFNYSIHNQNNELINEGYTTLVFVDIVTRRPVRMPMIVAEKIKKYFC